MPKRSVRVLTFLAPKMQPVYAAAIRYVSRKLSCPMELAVGSDYDQVREADFCFICGLAYVRRTPPRQTPSSLAAVVAPVLKGERYQNRPIYFSDVIVRRDSPFQSFADLRGCSWAFNEPESQSGYGITRYWLAKLGETNGFFGKVVQSGFHQRSIQMVVEGLVDAAAIDSAVLAIERRDRPDLEQRLRVVDALGPSTIQPLAASSPVGRELAEDVRGVFAEMHASESAREFLGRGMIDRFVAVDDGDYDDIRRMLAVCEQAGFTQLR